MVEKRNQIFYLSGNLKEYLLKKLLINLKKNYFSGHGSTHPGTKPLEPMFVSAPPKTQRLLHSNVYIK